MIQIHSLADTTLVRISKIIIQPLTSLVEIMIHSYCKNYRNRKLFLPGDLVLYWPSIWEDLRIVCRGHDSPTMEATAENSVVCSG